MKLRKPAFLLLTLALALPLIIAACGGAEPQDRTFNLQIVDRSLVGGGDLLKATQDDTITIVVNADEHASFHLHGYDIEETAEPGSPATLEFTANATGSFPFAIHVHDANGEEVEVELGRLVVQPR